MQGREVAFLGPKQGKDRVFLTNLPFFVVTEQDAVKAASHSKTIRALVVNGLGNVDYWIHCSTGRSSYFPTFERSIEQPLPNNPKRLIRVLLRLLRIFFGRTPSVRKAMPSTLDKHPLQPAPLSLKSISILPAQSLCFPHLDKLLTRQPPHHSPSFIGQDIKLCTHCANPLWQLLARRKSGTQTRRSQVLSRRDVAVVSQRYDLDQLVDLVWVPVGPRVLLYGRADAGVGHGVEGRHSVDLALQLGIQARTERELAAGGVAADGDAVAVQGQRVVGQDGYDGGYELVGWDGVADCGRFGGVEGDDEDVPVGGDFCVDGVVHGRDAEDEAAAVDGEVEGQWCRGGGRGVSWRIEDAVLEVGSQGI